jgi:hypothetical protein
MKPYIFKIPIYDATVAILFTDDFLLSGREIGVEFALDINDSHGLATRRSENKIADYVVMFKNDRFSCWNTIAHEALHVTNFLFSDRGITIDTKNDEGQAYMLGFIVGEIAKCREVLNKKAKRKKKKTK